MADVRIGCADLPPRVGHEQYFRRLDFLETSLCAREIPTDKVLRRWRTSAPPRAYALVAPRALAEPRAAAAVAEAFVGATVELDAAAVVFRTGDALTPGGAGRDALRRLFGELAPAERFAGRVRVWQPGGLWDLGASARFAAELGVVCAIDPLAIDPSEDLTPAIIAHLERGTGYLRPTGLGRARFGPADLESLAGLVEPLTQAFVVFANPDSLRSATSFRKLVGAAAGAAGDGDADLEDLDESDFDADDDADDDDADDDDADDDE